MLSSLCPSKRPAWLPPASAIEVTLMLCLGFGNPSNRVTAKLARPNVLKSRKNYSLTPRNFDSSHGRDRIDVLHLFVSGRFFPPCCGLAESVSRHRPYSGHLIGVIDKVRADFASHAPAPCGQ